MIAFPFSDSEALTLSVTYQSMKIPPPIHKSRSLRPPPPVLVSPFAAYHLDTLPNGLRIATAEMPHMASVSVGLWAAVGARHESARLNGAAHFLEHLLFKGTRRRDARQISGEVEALGGGLEAFTSEDHTCYYAKAEAVHLPQVADVLADIYRCSRFPAREVERERGVIREEILMYADQPAQVAEELLAAAVWPGHPLGRPLAGTAESVGAMRRADLLAFWRQGYCARASVLAVAGRVRREEVMECLAPLFGGMAPGARPGFRRWRGTGAAPRVSVDRRDSEQVQLMLGYTAPGRRDPRRFAARVLSAILGEKMNSRLFQNLRERRGLCYSVGSETSTYEETGLLSISVGLEARRLPEALRLIRAEARALEKTAVSAPELREARDYLAGQHTLALESTTNQMMWLGDCLLTHGRLVDPARMRECLRAVTAADVQAQAREILGAGLQALVAVGPITAADDELLRHYTGA